MLIVKENVNNVTEFNLLYDLVGWGHYDENISTNALNNTFYSVSVYDDEKIVGYGRIIGDTICFLYIQDVMVSPEYQGKKIGTMIMNKLLDKVKDVQKMNPSVRTYLGASKNKEEFYKKFGFITREECDLGAGMILNNN